MIKICKKSFLTHKLHFKFVINNLYCDSKLFLTIDNFFNETFNFNLKIKMKRIN